MPQLTDTQLAQQFASEHPQLRWERQSQGHPHKLTEAWFMRYAPGGRHENPTGAHKMMRQYLVKVTTELPDLAGTDVSEERVARILKLAQKYMKK
jgi:hypothetical protein